MSASRGRVVWCELMTTDPQAAEAFYADVLGWRPQDASSPGLSYALFFVGDLSVSGVMSLSEEARAAGAEPSWLGYFGVDDIDAAANRVARSGGFIQVPPTDIPGRSRFCVLSDPQRAAFGLMTWTIPRPAPPATRNPQGLVGWCELLARDWQQAITFYEPLLGWHRAPTFSIGELGTYQPVSVETRVIGGMFTKPATVAEPFWLYYFNVADLDEAAARIKAGGGQVLFGPMRVFGDRWIFHCQDPQGATFGLIGPRSRDSSVEVEWTSAWKGRSLKGRLRVRPD